MRLRQRIPNWSTATPREAEGSFAEVLGSWWVQLYRKGVLKRDGTFVRWSRSEDLMMVEYETGYWCVGYVTDPDPAFMDLPPFEPGRIGA